MKQYQDISQEIKLGTMRRRIRNLSATPPADEQTEMLREIITWRKNFDAAINNLVEYARSHETRLKSIEDQIA